MQAIEMTPAQQAIARLNAATEGCRAFMERQTAVNERLEAVINSAVSVQAKAHVCDQIFESIEEKIRRGPM